MRLYGQSSIQQAHYVDHPPYASPYVAQVDGPPGRRIKRDDQNEENHTKREKNMVRPRDGENNVVSRKIYAEKVCDPGSSRQEVCHGDIEVKRWTGVMIERRGAYVIMHNEIRNRQAG